MGRKFMFFFPIISSSLSQVTVFNYPRQGNNHSVCELVADTIGRVSRVQ